MDRLTSLFRRFAQLQKEDVCHQGIRNELVALLKGSYHGIDIIEDGQITTYAYLRERIFDEFMTSYEKSDDKSKLISALILWMADNDPRILINEIDQKLYDTLREKLFKLFIEHGSNPANNKIADFVKNAFSFLEFSCGVKEYPSLHIANEIFKASATKEQTRLALTKMQIWVKENFVFNDETIAQKMTDFYKMLQAQNDFLKNQVIIRSTGKMLDEFEQLFIITEQYLENFLKEGTFHTITDETLHKISLLNKIVNDIKTYN